MEDFNDCDGGPRAPIPYKLFDDLIAENRKLKTFIRDDYTQAPNDYGDDISTDLAIKLSEAQGELTRLRTALRGLVEAIKKAPHGMGCSSLRGGPIAKDWGDLSRCDCWKKDAIAAAEAAKQ